MSQKTDDCLTAALCPSCHHQIDNGHSLSREERRAELDKAVVLTLQQLAQRGLIDVKKVKP
jgi:ferredoxin